VNEYIPKKHKTLADKLMEASGPSVAILQKTVANLGTLAPSKTKSPAPPEDQDRLEQLEQVGHVTSTAPVQVMASSNSQVHPGTPEQVYLAAEVHSGIPAQVHPGIPAYPTPTSIPAKAYPGRDTQTNIPGQVPSGKPTIATTPGQVYPGRHTSASRIGIVERRMLAALSSLNHPGYAFSTNMSKMAWMLSMPLTTAKNAYYRLVKRGLVVRCHEPSLTVSGNDICLKVDPSKFEDFGVTQEELQAYLSGCTLVGIPKQAHRDRYTSQGVPEQTYRTECAQQGVPGQVYSASLDRLDRLRKLYLSNLPEEMDTWPNLVDVGLTEDMLLEDLENREERGISASLFEEDMAILDYNFGQPEWIKKINSKPLRYLRACIVRGDATPTAGYESPVQARMKLLRARNEARERELKELEALEIEAWWLELQRDSQDDYAEKFKHAPADTRKRLAWNEWRKLR